MMDMRDSQHIPPFSKTVLEQDKTPDPVKLTGRIIAPSRLPEIEHLLKYLRDRTPKAVAADATPISSTNEKLADPGAFDSAKIDETANMTDLDDYLDLLYEDTTEQLRGSALILQLARNPDNLEELCQNEILVGALARVLREDWRKNTGLTTNLVYIFFCFSSFSDFHSMIMHYKIGTHCMSILEHEIQNYARWMEELKRIQAEQGEDCPEYKENAEKYEDLVRKQEQLLRVAIYLLLNLAEKVEVEEKMHRKGIVTLLCRCLKRKNHDLLVLVVSFLRKLSLFQENIDEMIKNKVVEELVGLLAFAQPLLIRLTLRLLYNLSFSQDLRASMVIQGLPKALVPLLADSSQHDVALLILYQLSTEDRYRGLIASSGCLPLLMRSILGNTEGASDVKCLGLLINLACDRRAARSLGEPRGIRMLFRRAFATHDPLLMKLLRNLSQFEELGLHFLDYLPDLASVIVRLEGELSQNAESEKEKDDKSESADSQHSDADTIDNMEDCFSLECLGVMANLQLEELDFARILGDFGLLSWAEKVLTGVGHSHHKDDLVLEVIRMIATACIDVEAAKMIALSGSPVIPTLFKLINSRQEDNEIVFQILCVFYRILRHEETRQHLVNNTKAPNYIFDLMHDENEVIGSICNAALNIIADCDETWAETIRAERFKWRNCQWLQMVSEVETKGNDSEEGEEEGEEEEENFLPTHDFLMASSLLEDAAGWFAVPPPSPPPSSLDHLNFDPDFKFSTHDLAACYGDEDEDAAA
ncbi:kinesin associated protein 3 [Echinococcus multilocularis]|uniref:Kinesin associated protein 3 n=1 Tax=Echinococcus multilocularis TaxID=6211 RepID=A0A087W123_ECHMU|nr:kinesin associated protein 3 [Echinococcus multilocularis]